jgi:hypothetical protein
LVIGICSLSAKPVSLALARPHLIPAPAWITGDLDARIICLIVSSVARSAAGAVIASGGALGTTSMS